MKMTGARAVVECLKKEGVEVVFGYPGGSILPLYDEFYRTHFHHILTCHEQGAVHAADGYARVTGRPGVCVATSGPGICNMVTGIATANMDSIPMIIISGQVATSLIGRDSFQEADISGITAPITKHNYLVKEARSIPRVLKEAFYIASTGRPGPVLVDIAKDALETSIEYDYPETVQLPGYQVDTKGAGRYNQSSGGRAAAGQTAGYSGWGRRYFVGNDRLFTAINTDCAYTGCDDAHGQRSCA
ncbi:thiamine pyrophosphate-binding protein [Megasphaera cerevisiae]|uniref:thiamine pyrophosphate-binding protein n=1 Tax=Megasphaera cerevisiae TaxID=39029 RepID=UPI0009CEDE80|nr:thiamine pyrophosphate-binding protein [Megasphaera cerevisiae]SKA21564.1 Thiamine pyrophosphate enzyme, N-terminal TPP binding domain [Megasphaera cerevisiae DSM 20462]